MGEPLVMAMKPGFQIRYVDPCSGTVGTKLNVPGGITYFKVYSYGGEPLTTRSVTNDVKLDAFWDLEEGEGRAEVTVRGPIALDLDWKEPEDLARAWAEAWCDSAGVTDLEVLDSGPDGIHFTVSVDAPLPEADERGRTSVDLPLPPLDMSSLLPDGMDISHSETDGVLFFPAPVHTDIKWRIKHPEGLRLLPGPSLEMEWEDCSLAIRRGGQMPNIEVGFNLDLGGRPIIPAEYGGYRGLFIEATDPGLMRLVFADDAEE
jgi:hypothetical protein